MYLVSSSVNIQSSLGYRMDMWPKSCMESTHSYCSRCMTRRVRPMEAMLCHDSREHTIAPERLLFLVTSQQSNVHPMPQKKWMPIPSWLSCKLDPITSNSTGKPWHDLQAIE